MSAQPTTLVDLVRRRATTEGDRVAYTFLADGAADGQSITWAELHHRAAALAAHWQTFGVGGQPVLLAMGSGLRFVESLLACWYGGAIAVPVSLPRHARVKHRLDRVVSDCNAAFAVGLTETRELLSAQDPIFGRLTWLDPLTAPSAPPVTPVAQPVALLQYTSGSTGSPRGVVVTHANLMHNSALSCNACGHGPGQTIGGWLPMFHDMGLVGLLVQAAYSGVRCVFMSPDRFLMRPWLWLKMISDFGVCSSPAPNFAYDLCVDKVTDEQKAQLDLRHWRNALNGSEPVRARTLERFAAAFASCGFSREAFFPCYGLAEATLLVSGPTPGAARMIQDSAGPAPRVGCGQPMGDTQLAIVDSETFERMPAGEVGEIWVSSASCAQGYWNNPADTEVVFKARLRDSSTSENWLRTGDLGYIADGQLFITGRLRELIIIAGRNLFPADLEQTAEKAHTALAASGAAAFSIEVDTAERLVIAVELRRDVLKTPAAAAELDLSVIRRQISAAVAAEHGVTPIDVVLLRAGALPRTTSGKLRRGSTREQYLSKDLISLVDVADSLADVAATELRRAESPHTLARGH